MFVRVASARPAMPGMQKIARPKKTSKTSCGYKRSRCKGKKLGKHMSFRLKKDDLPTPFAELFFGKMFIEVSN